MRLVLTLMAVVVTFAGNLAAQQQDHGPIELVIRARAIERPALKYQLFPSEKDIKPGNAVPILLRLPWEQSQWMTSVFPKLHEWESRPLSAPEWTNAARFISS